MAFDQRTVTDKRRAANQAAALQSTGPKTLEGKQRAAFNSFQHGAFASQDHILQTALAQSGADPAALDLRRDQLAADWQPAGTQQTLLVDDLAWLYWRLDQLRLALAESQARRLPCFQLERDQRRFNALRRAPSFDHDDFYPDGCVSASACQDKFTVTRQFLDDLEACARQGRWTKSKGGDSGYEPPALVKFVYGQTPDTARGREFARLWGRCTAQARGPKPEDARAVRIRALIAEERVALAEEEALFRRQQEEDIERPEETSWPELRPLDEEWQSAAAQLERFDRQINAKVRLLIRLQQHAAKMRRAGAEMNSIEGSAELFSNSAAFHGAEPTTGGLEEDAAAPAPGAHTENRGTKPSEPLESITEAIPVGSLASQNASTGAGAEAPDSSGGEKPLAPRAPAS